MSEIIQDLDFIGFTFNGHHSSEFNILRVSASNRYNNILTPIFQDKTAQVPGADQTLFWESNYTQRSFSLNIAFDNITELNFRQMRQWLNGKDVGDLIFDEHPYKIYTAKLQSAPQLNFICFVENGERIYKGEGTINFICYKPFARSKFKYLDQYSDTNIDEWKISSGLKNTSGIYDIITTTSSGGNTIDNVTVYNAGDIETDIKIYTNVLVGSSSNPINLTIRIDGIDTLQLFNIIKQGSDNGMRINTKTELIEGVDSNGNLTGTLYNQFITSGNFFKIPVSTSDTGTQITLVRNVTGSAIMTTIQYDYLYF